MQQRSAYSLRGPRALFVALGGAAAAVALASYVLWPRHDATSRRGSDVYDRSSLPDKRAGDGELSSPSLRARARAGEPSAGSPTATIGGSSAGCEDSSIRFREVVAPCFDSQELCNVGVSVRFGGDGQPVDVSFISEVPSKIAEPAREARACVARSFPKLVSHCSKSKTVHYTQRCTLR